jgi:hypothetical protein
MITIERVGKYSEDMSKKQEQFTEWMSTLDDNMKCLRQEEENNKMMVINSVEWAFDEESRKIMKAVDISNGKLTPDLKLMSILY